MWKTAARPWRAPSWRLQQEKGRLETQWSALASERAEAAQNSAEPLWVKVSPCEWKCHKTARRRHSRAPLWVRVPKPHKTVRRNLTEECKVRGSQIPRCTLYKRGKTALEWEQPWEAWFPWREAWQYLMGAKRIQGLLPWGWHPAPGSGCWLHAGIHLVKIHLTAT